MQRGNFRRPNNLSYGYCSPFSSAPKFRMNTDWLDPTFAVMADKGPGVDAALPPFEAPPLEMRKANSNNHAQAGQNVLYGDGHVSFQWVPYCGYRGGSIQPDNIYTAAAPGPTTLPEGVPPVRGYFGRNYAPANWGDSYLVPSGRD
jgi:prepilin-type processing-associated H-X9-DG protein